VTRPKVDSLADWGRSVSVIVPAFNAGPVLYRCLDTLALQRHAPAEVVVVDDGSSDDTASIAARHGWSRCRVVQHAENEGLAASLNDGIGRTIGEFVMFLHADCELLGEDWLESALTDFDDPMVAWVTGHYEHVDGTATLVEKVFAALRGQAAKGTNPRMPIQRVFFSEGKCDVLRRHVLEAAGGVPRLTKKSGEDQLLSYKVRALGYQIVKDGRLRVGHHLASKSSLSSLLDNLRKEFMHGLTQAVINSKFFGRILSDAISSSGLRWRGWHPLSKVLFALLVSSTSLLWLFGWHTARLIVPSLVFARTIYYALRCSVRVDLGVFSILLGVVLGMVADFVYLSGLLWGLVVWGFRYPRRMRKPV